MKILYLNYTVSSFGPIVRSLECAKALSDLGHEVTLCYLHAYFRPPESYYDFMTSYQSSRLRLVYPARPNASTKPLTTLPKAALGKVIEGRPTLRGLFRQIVGSLRYVPREVELVDQWKPDLILARPDHILSFVITAKLLRHLPLVLECDGPVEELDVYWSISSRWLKPLDTWRAHAADALLYISPVCGQLWRDKGIPKEKLFLCPNAAHPDRNRPAVPELRAARRAELGIKEDDVILGFSGNLRAWHGVDLLLRAVLPLFETNKRLRLLFVGAVDDPQALALQDIPARVRRERLLFTGLVDYSRMAQHIDAADAMVIPYAFNEVFYFSPMKLFEAMCMGKVIVAPRLGQIAELLEGLESPQLYDPMESDGLSKAIVQALERISRAAPNSLLGADVRARIEAEHTWLHRGQMIVKACNHALSRHDEQ